MGNNKSLWIIIGITSTILAYCLVAFLTKVGLLIFKPQPSDIFTLGQLSVELILIPIVVFGFIFTMIQFSASQEVAKPQLYWEDSTGNILKSTEIQMPEGNGYVLTPQVVLINEGKAVTNWFLMQLDIPREIYLKNGPAITRLVGEQLNRIIDLDPHWRVNILAEKHSWLFMSNGKYALYPNHPQPICSIKLNFEAGKNYPENCTLPYVIYTDKGKEAKGELKIRLTKKQKQTSEA